MLFVDTRPRHQNAPRPAWKVAESFKGWLRKRRCACKGLNPKCGGKMTAAHVDYAAKGTPDAKGMGSKAADRWCIPLSAICARMQHDMGWPQFERRFLDGRGNAEKIAAELWRRWPGRVKWEAKNAA